MFVPRPRLTLRIALIQLFNDTPRTSLLCTCPLHGACQIRELILPHPVFTESTSSFKVDQRILVLLYEIQNEMWVGLTQLNVLFRCLSQKVTPQFRTALTMSTVVTLDYSLKHFMTICTLTMAKITPAMGARSFFLLFLEFFLVESQA